MICHSVKKVTHCRSTKASAVSDTGSEQDCVVVHSVFSRLVTGCIPFLKGAEMVVVGSSKRQKETKILHYHKQTNLCLLINANALNLDKGKVIAQGTK